MYHMVNTKKSRNAGRGPAPATTLSKLIKKLNEENQPPGGWYKPQASSLEKPQASSLEKPQPQAKEASSVERQALSHKPQASSQRSVKQQALNMVPVIEGHARRFAVVGQQTVDRGALIKFY
jgi:hypothetical protein